MGALGFLMVTTFVHEDEEIRAANHAIALRQRKQLDWVGIVLLSVGLAMVQYVLEEGNRDDWFESRTITACLALGLVSLAAFAVRELTAPAPVVDLRLFKDTAFLSANLIGAVQFAMLMANMFLLPVFMQEMLGFTAIQSGFTLLPRALVMLVMSPVVGKLYGRISARSMVAFGVINVSAGSFLMSRFSLQTGTSQIIFSIMVQGLGFSCLFIPLTAAALAKIPRHKLPDATGLQSLLRQMGGSIGLAVFATMLTRYGSHARASVGIHVTNLRPEVTGRLDQIAQGMVARGMDAASAQLGALKALSGMVTGQAMSLAFSQVFFLAGVVFLCVLPLLYFLKVPRPTGSAPAALE
ncbi:MAG: MFS transporter [Myxococcales bacterium]